MSSHDLTVVYVLASIIIGSVIVTYALKFIKIDLNRLLPNKQGRVLFRFGDQLHERFLTTISVSDPLSPPTGSSSRGYLETVPQRIGSRPVIVGSRQPKQITQDAAAEKDLNKRLRQTIAAINETYPHTTYLGRSTFEGDNITLFARHRIFDKTKYYGEILSADHLNGFMSIALHPNDVSTVIEKGWGQRHPLSTRLASWFLRIQTGNQPAPAPGSRVVLYAPRSQEDLQVIEKIINAAVWWVGGIDSRVPAESSC